MKKPFDKYSDAEQALYTLGFNMGYKVDQDDLKKSELMEALEKEYAQEKPLHPFSDGLFDGLETNGLLKEFLHDRLEPGSSYHQPDLEPDF